MDEIKRIFNQSIGLTLKIITQCNSCTKQCDPVQLLHSIIDSAKLRFAQICFANLRFV